MEQVTHKSALSSFLTWYNRNPKLGPTTPNDRASRKLIFSAGGYDEEMGMVCERADGTYWQFTTGRMILCQRPDVYLTKHETLESASDALYAHVLSELFRVICLMSDAPVAVANRTFKKRDRRAFSKTYLSEVVDNKSAFKSGIDWILRSEGFPRRPVWAKFLVQNRNGSFIWFEAQPTVNHNEGTWESAEGRRCQVSIATEDSWQSGIVRLTT